MPKKDKFDEAMRLIEDGHAAMEKAMVAPHSDPDRAVELVSKILAQEKKKRTLSKKEAKLALLKVLVLQSKTLAEIDEHFEKMKIWFEGASRFGSLAVIKEMVRAGYLEEEPVQRHDRTVNLFSITQGGRLFLNSALSEKQAMSPFLLGILSGSRV